MTTLRSQGFAFVPCCLPFIRGRVGLSFMGKKIIDQFTDLPISPSTKWARRNPEAHASRQRVWRDKNPDAWEQSQKNRQKKKTLVSVNKFLSFSSVAMENPRHNFKSREKDILRLHAKGKDVGSIAIWVNLPCSVVSKVIAKHAQ